MTYTDPHKHYYLTLIFPIPMFPLVFPFHFLCQALFAVWKPETTHCSKPEDLSQHTAVATAEATREQKPFQQRLAQLRLCVRLPAAHLL